MKIIKFYAENIKKLRAVEIAPEGPIVQITGANGSGKSSVLDAIYWALAGAKGVDAQPVRQGEAQARVTLDLGEFVVTRKFRAGGGSALTIEAANGARFPSPQSMLDALLGSLAFDPLAFARMDAKRQLETLRQLVPLDIDLDALDRQNALDYQTRTERNRLARDLEAQAAAIDVPADLPAAPIDVSALLDQMERAGAHNTDIEQRKTKRAALHQSIDNRLERARALEAEAQALKTAAADDAQRLLDAPDLPDPIDTAQLRQEIDRARTVNAEVERRQQQAALRERQRDAAAQAEALTAAIELRQAERTAAIAAAPMPVAGLAFGEGEVLLNGLPFTQASSAEQLRVSVAIAMAANPTLRVLRVKDGGLLDEASMALLAEMADAHDYQVWIETAGTHRPGIVMEDGAVQLPAMAVAGNAEDDDGA